jgi:hypothetical protein
MDNNSAEKNFSREIFCEISEKKRRRKNSIKKVFSPGAYGFSGNLQRVKIKKTNKQTNKKQTKNGRKLEKDKKSIENCNIGFQHYS